MLRVWVDRSVQCLLQAACCGCMLLTLWTAGKLTHTGGSLVEPTTAQRAGDAYLVASDAQTSDPDLINFAFDFHIGLSDKGACAVCLSNKFIAHCGEFCCLRRH